MMHSKKQSDYLNEQVILLGLDIADGETQNGLICPKCRGGANGDKAFSLTRKGSELLGICFRASCGYRTKLTSVGGLGKSDNTTKVQPYPELRVMSSKLMEERFPYLGLPYYRKLRTAHQRVCTPIVDIYGNTVGYSCRSYDPAVKPKTITYWGVDTPIKADFAEVKESRGKDIVLVEDQVSARMVSLYADVDTVALLGSHVSQQLVEYLWGDLGYRRILIALDEDATKKAMKISQRYSLYNTEVVMLSKDPKDMTPEEVHNVFYSRLY